MSEKSNWILVARDDLTGPLYPIRVDGSIDLRSTFPPIRGTWSEMSELSRERGFTELYGEVVLVTDTDRFYVYDWEEVEFDLSETEPSRGVHTKMMPKTIVPIWSLDLDYDI